MHPRSSSKAASVKIGSTHNVVVLVILVSDAKSSIGAAACVESSDAHRSM